MALNTPSFRYPFESEIAKLPVNVQQAHRNAFNAITDLYQANAALSAKVSSLSSSSASSTTTTENVTTNTETTVINEVSNQIGFINDQTGATSYTTAQSDYGKFLIFNDASAIAVTLSTTGNGISLPWACRIVNYGAGTATLTPVSGVVFSASAPTPSSGASSYALTTGDAIWISFNGTNFYVS